jgi:two-component system, cell cycle sensor histidine kinase and response regulator CckA
MSEKPAKQKKKQGPASRVAIAPGVDSRRRSLLTMWGLGAMTVLGTAAIVVPYVLTGMIGVVVSFLVAVMFFSIGGLTWLIMRRGGVDNQQETLLREAFHSVLTPQLITNENGHVILANRAFRGWVDLGSQNAEEALAARFSASPAVAAEFKQVKVTMQKGQPGIAELPVIRSGKVVEWRRIVARPIEGFPNFFHWRFEDISERRRMEKAMRDEQNKLLDFMANAPVGIYSVDQHGRFRFVNKTLAEWLQVTPEELVKGDVRLHDVLSEIPKGIAGHVIAAGPQGELRGEVMMRRRDGKVFPAAITQTVVVSEDGKTLRTRSIVRDLSPEREWQQALSVSEYRFQRLFAEAPIGVVLLDGKYNILECNHAFHVVIRRPHGGIVGSSITDLITVRDRDMTMEKLSEVLAGNDLTKPLEVHMASDREIICHIFVKRFGLAQTADIPNEQQGLMLYFIEVTEQKRLEIQFAQSQKMQAVGQLAGGVAHDFNNLLTAMIGFCDLLLQRHKPGDQSFNDIMQIKQNGNRAANLVRQLLAFSRQQTLQPKVLNLVDVLSELTNLMRRLIGSEIKLDMIHGRDVGLVKADEGQLEQVIVNLIVNARDAMPQGGEITIHTRSLKLDKPLHRGQDEIPPGEYIEVEIADTGSGIPKENLSRIFEPFFSTKEVGSGTGLGLSTVYGIMRQTGGFITVESVINKGTTFTIYFPAYKPKDNVVDVKANDLRDDKPGPDLTGVGTVLLVEDEDAVRVFSARALRNKGYNVLEARSGEEALVVLEKEGGDKIDLTVTDVVMPQMDGPTLYKHIRERWPNMKVVFVSGYTEDRLREQFKSGEVIYFLPKPFTLKQLAGKVKEVLGESG